MDPNENLREQRALSMELLEQLEDPEPSKAIDIWREEPTHCPVDSDAMRRLIELRNALDEWLTKGGALPAQWGRRQ